MTAIRFVSNVLSAITAPASVKDTVPLGFAGVPGSPTVIVKTTVWPKTLGLGLSVSTTPGVVLVTAWLICADDPPTKSLLPW